ncbi:MAG: HNH endonuclease [Thermoanaerobaculia bacterium]
MTVLKLLPASTRPWSKKIVRRHQPPAARGKRGYSKYRPCLRWEFGFSCAFCLIHESDISEILGQDFMQVEHFTPKSEAAEGWNRYSNCFYICRYCNNVRGVKPGIGAAGLRLLNPCDEIWAQSFDLQGDELRPLTEDAFYTEWAYDLNHPSKVAIRRDRRESIDESRAVLTAIVSRKLDRLLKRVQETEDQDLRIQLLEAYQAMRHARDSALEELKRRQAIPSLADPACYCKNLEARSLPEVLDEQTVSLDLSELG